MPGRTGQSATHSDGLPDLGQFAACLATGARKLDRVVASVYDEAMRDLGVRSTQVTLLVTIASQEPAAAAHIAESLALEQSSASRNIRRLIEMGLVSERPSDDDARVTLLSLTSEGRGVLRQATPRWEQAQAELRDRLGEGLADALLEASRRAATR